MSKEWDLMKDISRASNSGRQDVLAKVITDNCFIGMESAIAMAVDSFELTSENIKKHSEAALKLAKLKEPEQFRQAFRHAFLVGKIKQLLKDCIKACDKEIIKDDSWDIFNKGRKEAYEHILSEIIKNESVTTSKSAEGLNPCFKSQR